MRAQFSTAIAMIALAATAHAADFEERRTPVYFPPQIPVFTWTGLSVGGNAGAAFSPTYLGATYLPATLPGGTNVNPSIQAPSASGKNNVSFTAGGQIGYNYEFGIPSLGVRGQGGLDSGIVLGVVADAQYLDRHPSYGGKDDFFGTVRGRLGVAFGRTLVFGCGGLAYDTRSAGYTFGGGLEYSFTNNLSIGAEYLRVDLPRGSSVPATQQNFSGVSSTYVIDSGRFNVARAFINYRFGYGLPSPVVARY